jgi:hypothetical protein
VDGWQFESLPFTAGDLRQLKLILDEVAAHLENIVESIALETAPAPIKDDRES